MSANSTIWSNLRLRLRLGHAQDRRVEEHVVATGELRVEARRRWRSARRSGPRVSTLPASGRITPLISLSRVLLPEPLSPISPTDSPCSMVNETSLTALKLSLIVWRRMAAMVICLMVRW